MSGATLLNKLLNYVLEQDKGVDPRGFTLSQYKGFIRAKPDLQGLPGVDLDIKVEGDHIWLRVARLEAVRPPRPTDQALIVTGDDPNGPPPRIDEATLKRRIAQSLQEKVPLEFSVLEAQVRATASRALEAYTPLWSAWAEGEKPRRKTIALYGDLFAIKQQLETEETAKPLEVVWGIGVSSWKLSYAEKAGLTSVYFQYPLLTQAVELTLEPETLAVEVRPRAVDPRFEFDAFAACQLPNTADIENKARDALARGADRPVNPFDPGSYEHLLKLVAGNLHKSGRFVTGAESFPPVGEDLLVSDGWVLLSRPRANNYLHEDIERLNAQLISGVEIPAGPQALVTPPPDETRAYEPIHFRGLSGASGGYGKGDVEELFFPLPYNHEQVTIVEQMERSAGVAVQGPPGTGKTHTIANIICHYLATGKKVLVTAKGEQALAVLQSKIPAEVRPVDQPRTMAAPLWGWLCRATVGAPADSDPHRPAPAHRLRQHPGGIRRPHAGGGGLCEGLWHRTRRVALGPADGARHDRHGAVDDCHRATARWQHSEGPGAPGLSRASPGPGPDRGRGLDRRGHGADHHRAGSREWWHDHWYERTGQRRHRSHEYRHHDRLPGGLVSRSGLTGPLGSYRRLYQHKPERRA